jgi:hypothetical protein
MYPDFLCIGAQKAGTSWLYRNLKQHPGICLPPIKEIHYFDHRHFTRTDVFFSLLTGEHGHLRRAAGQLMRVHQDLSRTDRVILIRYLSGARGDRWYQSLFEAGFGLTGDFTPAYARLSIEDIGYIHDRMPAAKIIYLLRDPIDRAWSHAVMRFSRSRRGGLREPWPEDLLPFLRSQAVFGDDGSGAHRHKSSDYLGNLDRWRRLYPDSQIFVGFLEEIAEQPARFLLRLFEFLGIEVSVEHVPRTANTKVFARAGMVPPAISGHLAELYMPTIIELHERFANQYTEAWLARADRLRVRAC